MRIVFFGSPAFALPSLKALLDGGREVVAVVSQPDRPAGRGHAASAPPVKLLAQERGLAVMQPDNVSSPESTELLSSLRPDVFIVAAYGQILRRRLLAVPSRGSLNVHASLLPRHRGAAPVAAAILAGDAETGVTIMEVVRALDAGPMVASVSEPITPRDTAGSLELRLATAGAGLLGETLDPWYERRVTPAAQDESLATYAPQIQRADARIDWSLPAGDIWRRVRAFNPWPVAHAVLGADELRVLEAWPLPAGDSAAPGTVLAPVALPPEAGTAGEQAVCVQTGSGRLALLRLQLAGRKALSGAEFLRGRPGLVGSVLG
jgi:methionyl-tRNA formyltransferase